VNYAKLKLKDCDSMVISNPIMDDVARKVLGLNIQKKKNKFIFHASWARGGDVAIESVRQMNLKDCEFHAFDYLMATHEHKDSFFYKHNGVDKFTLFKHLAESEYFIYPLYTPYQDVHKDTFSCVVAEALAFNVKVITYPFGALPENFDYFCHWLELPPNSKSLEDIQKEPLTKDEEGIYKYTNNIVSKVQELQLRVEDINDISNSSSNYILDNFSVNRIGKMWINLLNSL
jgi:glycosyltransferase involved in cell wall biosynthesis